MGLNAENPYFKLYFSTPVIFHNGILPKHFTDNTGVLNGIELEIIAMFSGKPVYIGGFDMQKRQPKPMYKAMPAGTVFYCKAKSENIDETTIFEAFQGKALSEENADQGFGIAYVGQLEID